MGISRGIARRGVRATPARAGRKAATLMMVKEVGMPVFPHLVSELQMARTLGTEDTTREFPFLRVVKEWAKAMVEKVRVSKEDAIVAENLDIVPTSAT